MNLVRPVEVLPGLYQLRAVGARVTLLCDESGLVLVDAGGRGSLGLIAAGLKALTRSVNQVRLVVLTHCHPDHAGGLGSLVKATGAKVAVHSQELESVSSHGSLLNPFRSQLLTEVTQPFLHLLYDDPVQTDIPLNDGDMLPFAEGVQVVHTPGHTQGSICLYVAVKKLLIVGDALQYRFGRLMPPAPGVTQDLEQAKASLEKLLALDFETICFSHFPPLKKGAREALRQLVQKTSGR